ncbi:MAG: hypothetical protein LBQ40_04435 [Clostridiales bacterium]|jgi:hypothetical protein|nr:hypothetical protein [Clostridiales bacterium]
MAYKINGISLDDIAEKRFGSSNFGDVYKLNGLSSNYASAPEEFPWIPNVNTIYKINGQLARVAAKGTRPTCAYDLINAISYVNIAASAAPYYGIRISLWADGSRVSKRNGDDWLSYNEHTYRSYYIIMQAGGGHGGEGQLWQQAGGGGSGAFCLALLKPKTDVYCFIRNAGSSGSGAYGSDITLDITPYSDTSTSLCSMRLRRGLAGDEAGANAGGGEGGTYTTDFGLENEYLKIIKISNGFKGGNRTENGAGYGGETIDLITPENHTRTFEAQSGGNKGDGGASSVGGGGAASMLGNGGKGGNASGAGNGESPSSGYGGGGGGGAGTNALGGTGGSGYIGIFYY